MSSTPPPSPSPSAPPKTGHVHTFARRTRKDGTLVDVELLAAPLLVDEEAAGILGVYHDVTEVNRQTQYYQALHQVSPTAVITIDPQGNVTSWNPAAERLFGYTAEEAVGREIDDLVANREELRDEALEMTRRIAQGEVRLLTRPDPQGRVSGRRGAQGRPGPHRWRAGGDVRIVSRRQRAPAAEALLPIGAGAQPCGHPHRRH